MLHDLNNFVLFQRIDVMSQVDAILTSLISEMTSQSDTNLGVNINTTLHTV